jgi:hypothetical protein
MKFEASQAAAGRSGDSAGRPGSGRVVAWRPVVAPASLKSMTYS